MFPKCYVGVKSLPDTYSKVFVSFLSYLLVSSYKTVRWIKDKISLIIKMLDPELSQKMSSGSAF